MDTVGMLEVLQNGKKLSIHKTVLKSRGWGRREGGKEEGRGGRGYYEMETAIYVTHLTITI
jgi:hypothetical protein